MRTLPPLALAAALAATLLLTACDDDKTTDGDAKNADRTNGSACAIGAMGVQVGAGAAPAAGDTGNVTVTLTNNGARCTLKGFPAVDLVAADRTASVPADQAAQAAEARPLSLTKGATASFTITYVRGEAGGAQSLPVRKASFGLPGADTTQDVTWSYGEVALKGEAGEPDATVSAFQTAGD
ncbi:DUF4232 domain-containing protein [Streptomyces tuirus]|uniref:DUF4232 domain-containing protein n=1 Tax=Streptomyces tuirus TaxID=68278 RepID=A0A941FE02_9ACTN|nr:DUF4232 domain-containing protein [Streptomyces tuirus]